MLILALNSGVNRLQIEKKMAMTNLKIDAKGRETLNVDYIDNSTGLLIKRFNRLNFLTDIC
jgi:hypothetical protein